MSIQGSPGVDDSTRAQDILLRDHDVELEPQCYAQAKELEMEIHIAAPTRVAGGKRQTGRRMRNQCALAGIRVKTVEMD